MGHFKADFLILARGELQNYRRKEERTSVSDQEILLQSQRLSGMDHQAGFNHVSLQEDGLEEPLHME